MTDLVPTRLSLHAVAELLLAGPQYDASGTIRLRVSPGGFSTVADPQLAVVGVALMAGATEVLLDGRTIGEVAADVGVTPRPLGDVQTDHTDLGPDSVLTVEPVAAAELAEALRVGAEALAAFAPAEEAVLWPEHFDVAVAVEEVTYGVSPGDQFIDRPYVYVSPFSKDGLDDPFFNQPFGAATPLADIGGPEDVAAYFEQGRELLGSR
jgi:hypothetical protein